GHDRDVAEPGGERGKEPQRAVQFLLVTELGQLVGIRARHGHGSPPPAVPRQPHALTHYVRNVFAGEVHRRRRGAPAPTPSPCAPGLPGAAGAAGVPCGAAGTQYAGVGPQFGGLVRCLEPLARRAAGGGCEPDVTSVAPITAQWACSERRSPGAAFAAVILNECATRGSMLAVSGPTVNRFSLSMPPFVMPGRA